MQYCDSANIAGRYLKTKQAPRGLSAIAELLVSLAMLPYEWPDFTFTSFTWDFTPAVEDYCQSHTICNDGAIVSKQTSNYTVSWKKGATLFSTITLAFLGQYLPFFYQWIIKIYKKITTVIVENKV